MHTYVSQTFALKGMYVNMHSILQSSASFKHIDRHSGAATH